VDIRKYHLQEVELAVVGLLQPTSTVQGRSAHHHHGSHDRNHDSCHDGNVQRAAKHVSQQPESSALGYEIHAAPRALAGIRLTYVGVHGAQIYLLATHVLLPEGEPTCTVFARRS
jgi:hypothetical protein